MTETTQEAALFCQRCQRYRRFRFVAQRPQPDKAKLLMGIYSVRVIAHFYACAVCGHQQQWGCSG